MKAARYWRIIWWNEQQKLTLIVDTYERLTEHVHKLMNDETVAALSVTGHDQLPREA